MVQEEGGDILGSEKHRHGSQAKSHKHTHWLSFTLKPQAFEVLHTSANSLSHERKKQQQAYG